MTVLSARDYRIIPVPEHIPIKMNDCGETLVKNLTDVDIFESIALGATGDSLVVINLKPAELVKLDFKGNVLSRVEKAGEGPGEFTFPLALRIYGDKLYFLDIVLKKLIVYDLNFNYIRETKLLTIASDFIRLPDGQFVFPLRVGASPQKNLGLYSSQGDLIRSFGEKEVKYDPKNRDTFLLSDSVYSIAYDRSTRKIWVALRNRYDLSCYQDGVKIISIREKEDFFEFFRKRDAETGKKTLVSSGGPIKLELFKDKLYYFYKNHNRCFCDIFDKTSGNLLNRIQLARIYFRVIHLKKNIFYALAWDHAHQEDPYLYLLRFSRFSPGR